MSVWLITGFGACTSLGKQARSFCTLALEALASGDFGIDPQRAQDFQPVAILQNMQGFNWFAPYRSLPLLRWLRRKIC